MMTAGKAASQSKKSTGAAVMKDKQYPDNAKPISTLKGNVISIDSSPTCVA